MFHHILQQMSMWKKITIISLLYSLFTFRILYVIFKLSISMSLTISFLVGILYIIIIWSFSKEGMRSHNNWYNRNNRYFFNRRSNFNRHSNFNRRSNLNRHSNAQPIPIPQPKVIPPPVNEYKDDEIYIYNILNNSINPSLTNFNNDFKRLDDLTSYETEDRFNIYLRHRIQPELKNIKGLYDTVKTSLMKRASDTRTQNNEQGVQILFYNKDTWEDQQRQAQNIKSKINTFHSQIKGFIQRIKQQNQEESTRTIHIKPTPPLPPQDEYTYIPPSSSYLSSYSNSKYTNQYI